MDVPRVSSSRLVHKFTGFELNLNPSNASKSRTPAIDTYKITWGKSESTNVKNIANSDLSK
ncbi:hypothetical protein CFP56_028146 [Quercus suber]|uniref:Uncharacterized protein n=1 Tax=Quercus suber TaxID=58331 RepID=A0AAW0JVD3_QUESU